MAKSKLNGDALSFRPAKPEDAKVASRLLFETFPQKATFVIGLGDAERARRILKSLFERPGHRLSYTETEMVLYKGRVIGLFTAFPGQIMGHMNRRLDLLIMKQYKLRGKIAVFQRGLPLVFIKETSRNEYFISNLVVRGRYRSMGVGDLMLLHIERKAKDAGLDKLSLVAAIGNTRARQFYVRHGFQTSAIHLESNRRVPYLGAGYQCMFKDLSG